MSYYAKVGSFSLSNSKVAGDTEVITGLGFKPKLVFFWEMIYSSLNTWTSRDFNFCYGVANDAGEQGLIQGKTYQSLGSTSNSTRRLIRRFCLNTYNTTTSQNYENYLMKLISMDNDGFTLQYLISCYEAISKTWYLALGGDELKQTKIANFDFPSSTGLFSVTTGFKPDGLMIYSILSSHNAYTASSTSVSIGWASASNRQSVVSWFNQSGISGSNTSRYASDNEIMAHAWTSSVTGRASLNKFDKNGFTLNKLSGDGGVGFYVAFRGGRYRAGSINTRMDGNDITESIGYKPGAVMFASANMPKSSPGIKSDHASFSYGVASSESSRSAHDLYIPDAWNPIRNWNCVHDSAVYINRAPASGRMDVKSFDNTGFTCVMDDPDVAENWVPYFAFAPIASGTTQTKAFILGGGQELLPDSDVYADSWTNSASGTTVLYPYLRDKNPSTYVTYTNIPVGSGTFEVGLSNPAFVVESGEWYMEYMAYIRDSIASGLLQAELLQGSLSVASGIVIIGPSSSPVLYRYYLTGNEIAKVSDLNDLRIRMTVLGIK